MRIHEYQAKNLFKSYSVPTPDFRTAASQEEAEKAAQALGGGLWVVKAQVLAGGRGKAGGVKIAKSPEEAGLFARKMLGRPLVTQQTGPKGELVRKVLVEKGADIEREYYLSLLADPEMSRTVFMVSSAGGTDIEETARLEPEKITKLPVHPFLGFQPHQAWAVARALNISDKEDVRRLAKILNRLTCLFVEKDASLLEINPLIKTRQGEFIALDGKMSFDANALYRRPDIKCLDDEDQRPDYEKEALKHGLALIKLDGNIGCMVNGAGLAMSTMDMIKLHGGSPANFLDVGGSAETEKAAKAFEIILSFPEVKAVLVNIFGGIMKCDIIAGALIQAVRQTELKVPVVVRLEGTRAKEGRDLLKKSGLNLIPSESLNEAARKAVETASGHSHK